MLAVSNITFNHVLNPPVIIRACLVPRKPQAPAIQPPRGPDGIVDTQTPHQSNTRFDKSKTTPRVNQFWSFHDSDEEQT